MLAAATFAASDVAACIARHARDRGEDAGLDEQKLHNLLFLCQGYSLAAHGAPLFAELLWASPGGVSCPTAAEPAGAAPDAEPPAELSEVVARVWGKFGGLSPQLLHLRLRGHIRCVQEMAGGGPDLSSSGEAMGRAFSLGVAQGLI